MTRHDLVREHIASCRQCQDANGWVGDYCEEGKRLVGKDIARIQKAMRDN